MAKHLFKWCYFWLLADAKCKHFFFFFVQEGWGQTSRELFPQLPPVRAALSPGFWALYLTSRQDFVWSQGCNIIPAHSPVVSWQSGWAHYREQNKRCLLILSLAARSEIPLLLLISGSVCPRAQTAELCWGGKQGALLWFTENFTFWGW